MGHGIHKRLEYGRHIILRHVLPTDRLRRPHAHVPADKPARHGHLGVERASDVLGIELISRRVRYTGHALTPVRHGLDEALPQPVFRVGSTQQNTCYRRSEVSPVILSGHAELAQEGVPIIPSQRRSEAVDQLSVQIAQGYVGHNLLIKPNESRLAPLLAEANQVFRVHPSLRASDAMEVAARTLVDEEASRYVNLDDGPRLAIGVHQFHPLDPRE